MILYFIQIINIILNFLYKLIILFLLNAFILKDILNKNKIGE